MDRAFDVKSSSRKVDESEEPDEYSVLIEQSKQKFQKSEEFSEKIQILSLLPTSWSIKRISTEFGASEYLVRKTKMLVEKYGILPKVERKSCTSRLPEETIRTVVEFYENDESSRKKRLCQCERRRTGRN